MGFWIDLLLAAAACAVLIRVARDVRATANGFSNGYANGNGGSRGRLEGVKALQLTLLRQAGVRRPGAARMMWIARAAGAAGLPLVAHEAASLTGWRVPNAPVTLVLAVAGFVLPDLWILRERQSRRALIRRALSFYLDLVVSLISSGLSVERAVLRAARDGFLDPHPLADEVLLLGKELDLGQDSTVAFARLAERTGVPELGAVAAAMRIGLRKGAGVEVTLSQQAELLRSRYRETGVQRISRIMVVAMIPVFLCGVPMYAVIIFFPALIDMFTAWRTIRPGG